MVILLNTKARYNIHNDPTILRTNPAVGLLIMIFAIPYPARHSIRENPRKMPSKTSLESLRPYAFPYEKSIRLLGPGVIDITDA
jgi:hypothetical protein